MKRGETVRKNTDTLCPEIQFKYKRCQNIKIHRFAPINITDPDGV